GPRRAVLTVVAESGFGEVLRDDRESVGIVRGDDLGRFPAELQDDLLEVRIRRIAQELPAHLVRAREGDDVDVRVQAQCLPCHVAQPGTTFSTPSGSPASLASSAKRNVVNVASSGGLTTTEFPAARAGPSFHASIASGKFHGRTAPTTPMG